MAKIVNWMTHHIHLVVPGGDQLECLLLSGRTVLYPMNLSTFSEMKRTLPSSARMKKNPSMESRWGKPSHRNGGSTLLTGTKAVIQTWASHCFYSRTNLPLMTCFHCPHPRFLIGPGEILRRIFIFTNIDWVICNICFHHKTSWIVLSWSQNQFMQNMKHLLLSKLQDVSIVKRNMY